MTFAGGQVVSVYRLRLDEFERDVKAVESRLSGLGTKLPDLQAPRVDTAGAKQAAELARLNAALAQQQARAQAATSQAAQVAAVGQQRLAQAQNATAISAQRLAQAELATVTATNRSAQAASNAAAAQARAESAQLRLAQTQERVNSGQSGATRLTDAFKGSMLELAGSFGVVTSGAAAVAVAGQQIVESFNLKATLTGTQQQFRTLLGDVGRANQTIDEAAAFADKYKLRQTEVNAALAQAAPLIRESTASTEQQLSALSRLASLNAAEGIEGATFALRELTSASTAGEGILSLVERFNLSKDTATELFNAIQGGQDVFVALDATLNTLNVTEQVLIDRTTGMVGAQNNASKSTEDFKLALGTLVSGPGAGLLNFYSQATQAATNFVQVIGGQPSLLSANTAAVAASATTYAEYEARIAATGAAQGQVAAQMLPLIAGLNQLSPGLGSAALQAAGLVTQTQALTATQFAYMQALTARGVADQEAAAAAQAQAGALQALDATVAQAGGSLDAYRERMVGLAAANEGNLGSLQVLVTAFNAGDITAQQFEASLAALEASTRGTEQAAADHAAALAEEAGAAAQVAGVLDVTAQAAAGEAQAVRDATQAAYEAANAGGTLEAQARAAAGALLDAGNAGAAAAAKLGNSTDPLDRLTAAYYRLAAAQQAVGAGRGGLAGIKDTLKGAGEVTAGIRKLYDVLGTGPLAPPRVSGAGGGGGAKPKGGGKGGAGGKSDEVRAAEQATTQMARLDEQRIAQAAETQRRLAELETAHGEKILAIQTQYAQRQLEAERGLRVSSLNSKADFYDQLTQSTPEIGQDAAEGLAAAYEQAFAQAQQYAQSGQAALGASYLQLRQQQIAAELDYQQALAAAKEKGDQGEVSRLEAIEALRRQAREEELKQLVEGGDANVTARDAALTAEQQAFQDKQLEIAAAQAEKEAKLVASEDKIRLKMQETNTALAERLRLTQQVTALTGAAQPAAPTLPQAAAQAATTAAALPTAGTGGPVLVDFPALLASSEALRVDVARLSAQLDAQVAAQNATTEAARDTASAVRGQGRGLK